MNVAALALTTGAVVERAVAKGLANFENASWDLVDAANDRDFDVAKLRPEDLPAPMQKMSAGERKAFIEKHACQRSEIQARINQLNAEREKRCTAHEGKSQARTRSMP